MVAILNFSKTLKKSPLPFPLVYMSACVWRSPANGMLTHDNGDLMLEKSRKRRANIKPASGQHHIFTRLSCRANFDFEIKIQLPSNYHNGVSGWGNICLCITRHFSECMNVCFFAVLDSKLSQAEMSTNTGNYPPVDW